MNMAQLVKRALKENDLTQDQLAKRLGYVNGQFISNICRGLAQLPPDKFKKFAKITSAPLGVLIDAHIESEIEKIIKFLKVKY